MTARETGGRSRAPAGPWTVVDLFSGAGGMSCGFARRRGFRVLAAVDAESAKPGDGFGRLGCNSTYEANIGVAPLAVDIAGLDPDRLLAELARRAGPGFVRGSLTVLAACPPCTDFSRAKPANHLADSAKNSLVAKCGDVVEALIPEFVVMENAREFVNGNHPHHYAAFRRRLERLGYSVRESVEVLTRYGLPQVRERALIVASRDTPALGLDDLWEGWRIDPAALTVRHAIGHLAKPALAAGAGCARDPMHRSPCFASAAVRRRMAAIPPDGGSWRDLTGAAATHAHGAGLLTDGMKDRAARGDFGSHPDVYGRMAWDRPAPTIKRECAHVGNGRYAHPEQHRLLTVREMATLQGFPADYVFAGGSLANLYRHVGDAVPPLVSYQLSALVEWMKTGRRPERPREWMLPGCSLRPTAVRRRRIALAR